VLIQAARLPKLLRRLLTFVGPDPAFELPETIIGTMALEVDRLEWMALKGELPIIGSLGSALLAANFSIVGVTLPAGSGKLSVILGAYIDSGTNVAAQAFLTSGVVQDATSQMSVRDMRTAQGAATQIFSRRQVGAPANPVMQVETGAPGNSVFLPLGVVLGDRIGAGGVVVAQQLLIAPTVVAAGIQVTYVGYERVLEPAEANI
jgi:hypothetical protein